MERNRSGSTKDGFAELIFSWSLDDILNEDLYKHQVEDIPLNFQSEEHYLSSFVYPLLEETRAELALSIEILYKAPFAEVLSFRDSTRVKDAEKKIYHVTVGPWGNRFSKRGKEPYRTLPGDLLIISDGKPESVSDLHRLGKTWAFSLVNKITDDDIEDYNTSIEFQVKASQQVEFQDGMFVVFLMNVTTQKRIWSSLHMHPNKNIIKEVLYSDFNVKENCNIFSFGQDNLNFRNVDPHLLDMLNESQRSAITEALCKTKCCHKSSVEQIWGPPGTGKTTTVSVLLFILLQMNRRTLTCAPTNTAIVQVASRVLRLVKESFSTTMAGGDSLCSVGDVLLFGNKERLKVGSEIEEIYLEHRVKRLTECLGSLTGWKHCLRSMIDLLQNCVSQYDVYVENELFTEAQLANESQMETKTEKLKVKSFIEFLQDRFSSCSLPLRRCIITFCTHIPRSFMGESNFQNMIFLLNKLNSFGLLLSQKDMVSEELQHLFTSEPMQDDSFKLGDTPSINSVRIMSLSVLRTLLISFERLGLPNVLNINAIMDFCFEKASLIFCTTSSSYKLHNVAMAPLSILVIDEAAQLKEAESTIPLQLPGVKHAILIGDERQLPAMVTSNVCIASKYGRSLFDRLSSLGHSKHLLNVQYRMHPTISFFPNWKFYQKQILDAENVTCKSYEKRYLSGPMFGSYSFINVVGGREEKDEDGRSWRNMVEVAIVIKIVQNLHKAWSYSKRKLTVGVVSPYAAQVVSIQDKLAHKYEKLDGFSVNVKSIDGFQGGEEDIIILSTVRSNSHGNVGFLFSLQRTNVALTRARHCLWILGNEKTLVNSESKIWKDLVCDARKRCCLFDADVDDDLKMTIISTKKELEQLDDLVNGNSVLFKNAKWKVLFSDDFRRSFGKLTSAQLKKMVLNLLLKLSSGWRPKNKSVDLFCETSSHILKQFKVEGLYVICTTDIIKECKYIQVFKVWDILKFEEIPKLTKRLESIFAAYTEDYINRCAAKCLEGNLEVPRSWPASQELIRFRYLSNNEGGCEVNVNLGDGRNYVESSKVSESLLLMKFYSLSSGVVNQLLSGKDVDLPMQVTDEQMDIILFCKSSFIIGRSGTGKTTILTMKLFQKEQLFRVASEGFYEESKVTVSMEDTIDDPEETKPTVLRQLFVTVSPKLCYAVKQHVSHLVSTSSNGNSSAEINLDEADVVVSDFSDIPDTFVDIPMKSYPLVITFHKFLMMLDGTLGNSYFERFLEAREGLRGNHISSRSVALQTFIRSREVTFDRFCSLYWPHFNSNLTKRHDPSRVFTEIISHIKGGLQAGECVDGKLSYERYSLLAGTRSSTLTKEKRKTIYTIFQAYEKMKTEHGDFDLGDLVNDIHERLENGHYQGDKMDFVYIDEVQDLSMRQISLFKHICQNVDEGFVFAGDTAQTIARGIDFRFQDIRSLFYKEFLIPKTEKQDKGLVSEIFQLKQNFRTHAGVLELAQSVIDILYCYFIHSIDILEPEVSLISGEAPVLLESGNDENAIVTIFCGSGSGGEIVGFGAEQVILVRDDHAKTEIFYYVGKNALVLTILECKGLEFQDVLLYNFFGTSPLKDQWRVIYGYMKERDWLIEKCPQSFPSFNESRHSVLCSELKQLYVAITRTRQRLWICENKEELSKPMFDYWKTRGLVQIRKLDDSVAQAMRVASGPQEWRERGKKLFYENNFVMATMCFERAGDTCWENFAKASGLRASANQIRGTNPETFIAHLRDAIGMFESIGKLESAASCYYDLGEYEIAGKIYLDKCGKTDAAAECFTRAGCYGDAAEAYAKGDRFSNCLKVCKEGKLFDKGMQYIEYWKEHDNVRSKDLEEIEQNFLESCALDYHEHKDLKSMMKFVRAFCSMESKRVFLRSVDCLDDLLILEEESGNFLDAAKLASSLGDILKEAVLLEKAGLYKDATVLLVWYVLFSSLWGNGNKGWPLKQFAQKEKFCEKAKSLAKMEPGTFFDAVCSDLKVLSDQQSTLSELNRDLQASQKNKSFGGEFFSIRKILDCHFNLHFSKYDWEDELPIDINKHCENKIFQNRVSVRTLIFYWNMWKENVMDIFQSLESFHVEEPNEHEGHVEFSLNFFGVRKQRVNDKIVYLLVNKDAAWIRRFVHKGRLNMAGKLLAVDIRDLVFSIKSYWQEELLSMGIKALETLEALYKSRSDGLAFQQSTCLLHIFEVSKFLLDYKNINVIKTKVQRFFQQSLNYSDLVFPLDCRRSVSDKLISLRETDLSRNLLESKRVFLRSVDRLDDLLVLEEKLGNFLDAAKLARSLGNILKEADLLEKAGLYTDATVLLVWYVLLSSLWGNGNKGWPLKQFAQKEKVCEKAKLLAEMESGIFFDAVCSDLKLLSDQQSTLSELNRDLQASQKNKSFRGEFFSIRKILDCHFSLHFSKYDWEDELPIDINKHCEHKTFQNRVSVRTLICYWNMWKENVMDIYQSLESFHVKEPNEHDGHFEFCLNFFGVRKQCVNGNIVYLLVNKDAAWIRNFVQKGLDKAGKPLTVDIGELVSSIKSYWQTELLSVGLKALETLEALYKSRSDGLAFHQSTCLLHIFEVSKFLLDCENINVTKTKVQRFLQISLTYSDLVFPLDWRRSVSDKLISLRETDLSRNLLDEIVLQNVNIKGNLNYRTIGNVMMICLGSRKPEAVYEHIIKRIQWNPAWQSFVEIFWKGCLKDVSVAQALQNALEDTFSANWRLAGYISPNCFVYLLESLFMASFSSKVLFTARSSLVQWFTHLHLTTVSSPSKHPISDNAIPFLVSIVQQILCNKSDTLLWIKNSNIDSSYYHRLLVLKLVMILSLICLQVPDCSQVLLELLCGRNNISYLLPKKFVGKLLRERKGPYLNLNVDLVAEAFKSVQDPLLIVNSDDLRPKIYAPSTIFVDVRKSKEEIMSLLFPRKNAHRGNTSSNSAGVGTIPEVLFSNTLPDTNVNLNNVSGCKGKLQTDWKVLNDISEAVKGNKGVPLKSLSAASTIKKELDKLIGTLGSALEDQQFCAGKDATVICEANGINDDLKLLASAFDTSQQVEHSVVMKSVQGLVERLQSSRPTIDDFLNHAVTSQELKVEQMVVSESSNTTEVDETGEEKNHVEGTGDDGSPVDAAPENKSSIGNTQDAKSKKSKTK